MGWDIRKKLIIFLMLVTVLPFGSSIAITYYQTTKALNERFVSTNHDLIVKGKEDITSYLQDIAEMSTVLYRYTPFMNVFRDGISDDIQNNQEEVHRALIYLFNTRPEIEQMHLYINNGKDSYTIYHSSLSGRGKYENVFSHPYYSKLICYNGYSLIEPPHLIYSYNHLSFIPNSEKVNVLSFHNIIRDVPSDNFLGFLSIDINLSKISSIADRLYTKNAEDLYIMDENGRIIYSSNKKVIGTKNNEEWFQQVKQMSSSSKSIEWKDQHFSGVIVSERFSAQFKNWYIVKRIPYNVLYQSARQTALMNIFIGLITLVIVLFATMVVSFKITAPIKVLSANMKKVEAGEFEADFDSFGNDEIGMLGRNFKSMIAKINELIEREYKLDIQNKASQLRVLRSQINPHFLYNALQSIGTLALKHNAAPVYSLITSLSNIMRYSMNMKEDIVPFSSEIKHVKSYLLLQKQRFEEQFEFELDIQKKVEGILVPKMILQPIVENCFKHGFDQQEEKAAILIEAWMQDEELVCIRVKDNGIGVNEEQLRTIRRELNQGGSKEERKRESIGLKNIHDRLQIYYANQAKLFITGSLESGFTVTIQIPTDMPKEVEQS
ncbi:sensor histidine kinase [Neobacillus ginsengisoli]|uniref:Two-component system sensor histidine kinase YesM n=1 Tax=Neobacillus ginsengisoli TaxID=904295 RepID=A0ABT9XR76_9BACI|nr:sensor histidine kinase [Neobacillus ginsengisoli]MDQ0197996.1 two-component system sensor histidine kinase YesM [Neobacillus ginsengisoli]